MNGTPTDENLSALETQAKSVREIRDSATAPPVVVEFSGSPKSGKSTNIDILAHFFKRMGFKIWAPTEGASKRTPYHLRRNLVAFNTWSLNYAISELLVAYYNVERPDLVVLDRGPFDSIAWMRMLQKDGTLAVEGLKIIEQFALHPQWFRLINRIYLFTCSPEVSLERENQSKLTRQGGTAMNEPMLRKLLEEYTHEHDELKTVHPVRQIDTSATHGPLETAYPIALDMLNLLEGKSNAE